MAAISKYRNVRSKPEPSARPSRSKKQPRAKCSHRTIADGFLKHQFLPLYEPSSNVPDKNKVEQGFFTSLSTLGLAYGCEPTAAKDKPYPYNILLSHWYADKVLRERSRAVLTIEEDDNGVVQLVTTETFEMNNTLWYIPVLPLYRLLQEKKRKGAGELLLSVFAYLYHEAGIPYYRHSSSALDYYYEMLYEWTAEDPQGMEEQEFNEAMAMFRAAVYYGDDMHRKMYNRYHLNVFEQRVSRFMPQDSFDTNCLQITKAALALYQTYPHQSVFRNITPHENEEDLDDGIIRAEQWISFIADNRGWLYDQLEQSLNCEFQECCHVEEPTISNVWNSNGNSIQTLDFEYALFEMIDNLCTLLNEIP